MFSKSLIQFSVDGWSCVPSLLFTWGQIMVEVMKIMVTFFKRSQAGPARLSARNPAAGHHHWPTPLLETPGHSRTSLGQSLVGSLLLSSGSWGTRGSVCALQESVSQACVSSGSSMVRLMVTSSKRAYAIHTQVCCTQSPCPCTSPLLTHHSTGDTQNTVLSQSLWGIWVLECTRFVWTL